MSSSYLNSLDQTKQFIIDTPNYSFTVDPHLLHDKCHGYLHIKKSEELLMEMDLLSNLAQEDVHKTSRFLLEINFTNLSKFH